MSRVFSVQLFYHSLRYRCSPGTIISRFLVHPRASSAGRSLGYYFDFVGNGILCPHLVGRSPGYFSMAVVFVDLKILESIHITGKGRAKQTFSTLVVGIGELDPDDGC